MRAPSLLLIALLVAACAEVGTADPPTPRAASETPSLTITGPTDGASVPLAADAPRTLWLTFEVTGLTLREPGTCLASDQPCGHVVVHVDGDACNADGADFNSAGSGSPLGASMVHCADAAGSHEVQLSLAKDDRTAWTDDDGAPIAATITVTTEVPSLYDRLGGGTLIRGIVSAAFTVHVLPDARVNAYFHNDSLDLGAIVDCMATQIGAAAGGPDEYACGGMEEVHAGLGISPVDFADFLADFEEAALYHGVGPADVAELLAILGSHESDIVEDPGADNSLYQRLGRRPGIEAVVADFSDALLSDLSISPFFVPEGSPGPVYSARTGVCFARLICSVEGPCEYGRGTEPELEGVACLNMRDSHVDRTDPSGTAIGLGHFARVAEILLDQLDAAGVSPLDQELVLGALAPTCCDIVAENTACQGLFDALEVDLTCDGAR